MLLLMALYLDRALVSASGRTLEQLASDQHAADLLSARADLVQLGITQQPPGGIIVRVAIAAQRLNRLQRRPSRMVRRKQDATRSIPPFDLAAVARLRDRVNI